MSIVANNCIRFNMSMDFWLLRDYTAEDLLNNWKAIVKLAGAEESEENEFFLADCMDVLYEKVMKLADKERSTVLDKAREDLESISIGRNVLRLAG